MSTASIEHNAMLYGVVRAAVDVVRDHDLQCEDSAGKLDRLIEALNNLERFLWQQQEPPKDFLHGLRLVDDPT